MKKPFKLVSLLGIRPDYIRMFKLIKLLDSHDTNELNHVLVHSGQHYDPELYGNFLKEFDIRKPDFDLEIGSTLKERGKSNHAYQLGLLSERVYDFIQKEKPDAVMYLGDTNTILSSVAVARCGVPVIHIEAGGRSFDWRMPEEKNRVVIDHLSDGLYSYLPRYKEILKSEGIEDFRVNVIGNIIIDAVDEFTPKMNQSSILKDLNIESNKFILITLHREENTSTKEVFENKIRDIAKFAEEKNLPVVFPIMPRVREALERFNLTEVIENGPFITTEPLGFLNFLKLEKEARIIVSDSGTVQEEALLLGTSAVIARRSTERPETIEAGATILEGFEERGKLYKKLQEGWELNNDWDKSILNPNGGSPSQRVYEDIINKIKSGYFENSRSFEELKNNKFVRKAYNK